MEKEETQKKPTSEKGTDKGIWDKSIDFIFSNDERKWLILILLVGVVLRFFVARNISALGDEMVHGPHAIGFLHSGLISTIAESPLWFYLTDIAFKIFGVTMFSTRFLSFFYGSLSILVIYLIVSRMFDKKTGLISAFLLAVSYYIIRYTLMEMDLSATFFMLVAVYFFLVDSEKGQFPYIAAISIGIASLIKTLSLFFVPAFLIAFFIFNRERGIKQNIKYAIYFGLIILAIFSPILIHNYLWYKDGGMVDVYFAQYFNVGKARQAYAGLSGYDSGFLITTFFEGIISISKNIFFLDPIIVSLGILGLIYSFSLKEKRKYWIFLVSFEAAGFILLSLSNLLPTHFTAMIPVLCILGGFFINEFSKKFKNPKKILRIALSLIFIVQIYMLLPHLTSQCAMSQMRSYASENMDKNSIVVVDARIYRGRIAWLFNDFNYLESSYLPNVLELNQNLSGQEAPVKVYFIECVRDDCGWGTIGSQPEFNQSTENIVKYFSQKPPEKTILSGGGYDEETGKPYFAVYQTYINLKPQVLSLVSQTHDWFYYPINYEPKDKIFDNYGISGGLDDLIYKFAWLITIVSIILAILMPFYIIYWLIRENQNEK